MRFKVTHNNVISGVAGTLLCCAALFADSPANLLISQFTSLDSILAASALAIRPSKCDSASMAPVLENLLCKHPGFSAVAFADAGGGVVAFAGNEARGAALSRSVSRSEWFAVPRKTRQPYYGALQKAGNRFCVIWSRPVSAGATLGLPQSAGVLYAYVNIAECLKTFAQVYRRPFEIGRDSTVFYHSDDWQGGLPHEEEQISLMGGLNLVLRYTLAPLETDTTGISARPVEAETKLREDPAAAPAISPLPNDPPRRSLAGNLMLVIVTLGLASGAVYAYRRNRKHAKIRAQESALAAIVEQEQDAVRKNVKADLYREIRSRIGKPETARIEQEIKTELSREIEKAIMANDGGTIREEVRGKVRVELIEEIRRQLLTTENASLREEARGKILGELMQRLRKEVGGQLEMEALQALARTVHSEVRAEHAKPLRDRAMKELDERIRQEVLIRESAVLYANAREAQRELIEKEIREKEGSALRAEARASVMQEIRKQLSDATGRMDPVFESAGSNGPEEDAAHETLREALVIVRKIDESEALSSLAKTVDLLKSSQQSSPYFNLNAAQTSSMIEYLGNVSIRLQKYIAGIRNGLGRLSKGVEPLLRENRNEEPPPAAEDIKTQTKIPETPAPETETLIKSE